ncbi:hypothetical protein FOZ60_003067 [Perkinsus olseni]|uniref:Uncharacterized protein n=1 Tax=Perkinsus olseni TaxID=32597 RepID=A0A7J6PKA8_PEROL|nr:hypothetical protein FOZ60_003067 [Perkinsus olseni]
MSAGKTMNEMKAWQEIFDKERAQQRKWIQDAFEEYEKSGQKLQPRYKFDGRGSTMWIGLNADPCKAKYLAKLDPGLGDRPDPTEPQPPPKSSATRFLEQVKSESETLSSAVGHVSHAGLLQRFGLSPSPYCQFSSKKVPRPELLVQDTADAVGEELLVYGVSGEGEGRKGYLDFRKLATTPQQGSSRSNLCFTFMVCSFATTTTTTNVFDKFCDGEVSKEVGCCNEGLKPLPEEASVSLRGSAMLDMIQTEEGRAQLNQQQKPLVELLNRKVLSVPLLWERMIFSGAEAWSWLDDSQQGFCRAVVHY